MPAVQFTLRYVLTVLSNGKTRFRMEMKSYPDVRVKRKLCCFHSLQKT